MLICATVTSPAETLAILKNKLSSIFEYGLYSRDSVAHPPRYGDQIEERVTLLIGCVEQVLGFSLPENLVNPLRKHFTALIGYVQRGLIPQLYSSSLIWIAAKTNMTTPRCCVGKSTNCCIFSVRRRKWSGYACS